MSDLRRRIKAVQAVLWAIRVLQQETTGRVTGGSTIPTDLTPEVRERVIVKAVGNGGYLTRADIEHAFSVPLPTNPTDDEVDSAMLLVPHGWRGRICRGHACACMGCIDSSLYGFRLTKEAWDRWWIRHPDGGPPDSSNPDDPYEGVDPLTLPLSERLRRRKAREKS